MVKVSIWIIILSLSAIASEPLYLLPPTVQPHFYGGAEQLHDYDLRGSKSLAHAISGLYYRRNRLCFSGELRVLSAFELYQKSTLQLGVGYIGKRLRPTLELLPTRETAGDEAAIQSLSLRSGLAVALPNVSLIAGATLPRVGSDRFDFATVQIGATTAQRALGSQRLLLTFTPAIHRVSIHIGEEFPLTEWFAITASLDSKPLFLSVGCTIKAGPFRSRLRSRVHRHLGSSRLIVLEYYPRLGNLAEPIGAGVD